MLPIILGLIGGGFLVSAFSEDKKYAKGGSVKKGAIYEVGIDEGKDGTRTLADFETKKDAQNFMYEYNLKHPKAKLFIDTVTSDRKMAKGGSVDSEIEELWKGYAEAVLFTEEELGSDYTIYDFDKKTETSTKKMLADYYKKNKKAIEESELSLDIIGNDIWYTRSGQGVGFFDHSLDDEIEKQLTDGAKAMGEFPSVETHNGKVSISSGKVFAKGGMMAKGGGIEDTHSEVLDYLSKHKFTISAFGKNGNSIKIDDKDFTIKDQIAIEKIHPKIIISGSSNSPIWYIFMPEKDSKMADGGMMADGGKIDMGMLQVELKSIKKKYPNAKVSYTFAKDSSGKGYVITAKEGSKIVYSSYKMADGGMMAKGGSIATLQKEMDVHKKECLELYPNGKMALINGLYGVMFNDKLRNTLYIGKEYFEIDGTVYKENPKSNIETETKLKLAKGGKINKTKKETMTKKTTVAKKNPQTNKFKQVMAHAKATRKQGEAWTAAVSRAWKEMGK